MILRNSIRIVALVMVVLLAAASASAGLAPLGAATPDGISQLKAAAAETLLGAASLFDWASCGFATGVLVAALAAPEPSSKVIALSLVGEVLSCYSLLF